MVVGASLGRKVVGHDRSSARSASALWVCARSAHGTTGRAENSAASATTCARSPSPSGDNGRGRDEIRFLCERLTGVGDLVAKNVRPSRSIRKNQRDLCAEYEATYNVAKPLRKGGARHESLRYSARIELACARFSKTGDFKGFTTTFEDLHGLRAAAPVPRHQRLMPMVTVAGEGDWKTAALVRAMKVMGEGPRRHLLHGDYTYHMSPKAIKVLGAHMPRNLPEHRRHETLDSKSTHSASVAKRIPCASSSTRLPARAQRLARRLGNRFRLIVNEVTAVRDAEAPEAPRRSRRVECKPDFRRRAPRDLRRRRAPHGL